MAKKETKTNAMRILETMKIPYEIRTYDCEDFVDGVHLAEMLQLPYEQVYKTLVTVGKSKNNYVFVIPVAEEIDFKKAAKAVGEKSLEMLPLKDLTAVTGYIRGGCTAVGMKKKFPTYIDETCILYDEIAVSAGERGHQMIIPHEALIAIINAKLEDLV